MISGHVFLPVDDLIQSQFVAGELILPSSVDGIAAIRGSCRCFHGCSEMFHGVDDGGGVYNGGYSSKYIYWGTTKNLGMIVEK